MYTLNQIKYENNILNIKQTKIISPWPTTEVYHFNIYLHLQLTLFQYLTVW